MFTAVLNENNIKEIERIINSDKFLQFLLNNSTQIENCIFILQSLNEKLEEAKKEMGIE